MNKEEEFVSQCKEMVDNQNWCEHSIYRQNINSSFAQSKNWIGLINFYDRVLEIAGVSEHFIETLQTFDYSSYEDSIATSFTKAITDAEKNSTVKGIYFEYEDGQANFFLCQKYNFNESSDWAAYWENSIESSELSVNIDLFADDLSNFHQLLVTDYLDAKICVAVGKAINGYSKIPVAMAEHDNSILHYHRS